MPWPIRVFIYFFFAIDSVSSVLYLTALGTASDERASDLQCYRVACKKNVPVQSVSSSYGTCSQGISQFYLHTHTVIRNRNKPYLPLLPSCSLVLIYRPRRDGRLSRPWCEVAPAEIRTSNLPITNQALYHSAIAHLHHSLVQHPPLDLYRRRIDLYLYRNRPTFHSLN